MPVRTGSDDGLPANFLLVRLLGPFLLTLGERSAGPWGRPSARRLCQFVLVSPGRHVGREVVCEALFPHLGALAAANELRKALSMARAALSVLGEAGAALIVADRSFIWAQPGIELEVDYDAHREVLKTALSRLPGLGRDDRLVLALAEEGTLLEDEPYAEWALRPREDLEALRQEARLALARDRARGYGRSRIADVAKAWEACARADPASEEVARALVRAYLAQGRHSLALTAYERCHRALEELGLRPSSTFQALLDMSIPESEPGPTGPFPSRPGERRLVSVLVAEIGGRPGPGERLSREDRDEWMACSLAEVGAQVEAFGGTVSSVSGAGLVALFGAPAAHEDDPERALRAALRSLGCVSPHAGDLHLRVGVETGQAVVGPITGGSGAHYGAVGEAVGMAAALQSSAKPGCVLVGPATRAACEGIFEWGATEEVTAPGGGEAVLARYLQRPRARVQHEASRRRLAGSATLVGRAAEMAVIREALGDVTAGRGGVVILTGDPGLGKTRLVQECGKLFMAWAAAGSGRLPIWLEGRAVSYRSSTPFGLYEQLLRAWVGITPEDADEVARAALLRAMTATYAGKVDTNQVERLSMVMGLGRGAQPTSLSMLGPVQLQRACFSAVRDLVSCLTGHGPTVLALEDLHWADPTSLHLTEEVASLSAQSALLLVLTRRPEPDPGTSALESALLAGSGTGRRAIVLKPLADVPQRQLAYSLLGEGATDEIVEAITDGAEGNPLFLEERMSSLLDTGMLLKSDDGRWRLDIGAPGQVPEALERLVRARVDRLPAAPHQAIVTASVLGPEFSLSTLVKLIDLGGELQSAVSDLLIAGLIVELAAPPEPAYRFRHALIQEAIYKGLLRGQRARLHARAAWALEDAFAGRLEEVAGLLGRHFAMAGEPQRAARYLEMAGDRAAAAFANDEAAACYRWALELVQREEGLETEAVECGLKLGALFWRLGRYSEGREALLEAGELVPPGDYLLAARCHRWLGQLEIEDGRDTEALAALDQAEAVLHASPVQTSDEWVEAWLDVQLSRSNLHWWRNEPDLQAALLERIRPMAETRAGLLQKADFYVHLVGPRIRARRFVVDDSILAEVRAARSMVVGASKQHEGFHWQTLGFDLLLHGDIQAAQTELNGALVAVRRSGDRSLELACLAFLAWAHLRQGEIGGVKQMIEESTGLMAANTFPASGMMRAMEAWVAWKEERLDDVERLAREALDCWQPYVARYPFCWICLWPLIGVRLAARRHAEAVEAARDLVNPDQMRLPMPLEALVVGGISAWDAGRPSLAVKRLREALYLAGQLNLV